MKKFSTLSFTSPSEMMFGQSLYPVKCGFGLEIGNGLVLPEVNYTLPSMQVDEENSANVLKEYEIMVDSILSRSVKLAVPGVVLEFEHAPQMTDILEMGVQITERTKSLMKKYFEEYNLKSALRVTICDIREQGKPPLIRSGIGVKKILDSFEMNAKFGADMLAIESIGGKEVHDMALMEANVPAILFALGILAPRDMHFLWKEITAIATRYNVIPSGDTACGFANTAMVLADKQYIPSVLAAVIRTMTVVRSLVAYEEGAVGPSKDCGYEGPVIKAITGTPISMEGKTAACAHFSHMGNIAAAVCDLWSNESVQNVKLLSGFAPEVFTEVLAYDCRLMNRALESGLAKDYQKLLVDSDEFKSVHAFIISPESSFKIAETIVGETDDFKKTHSAGRVACELMRQAVDDKKLELSDRELTWLDRIQEELLSYTDEQKVLEYGNDNFGDVYLINEYGM